ncbi:MAG: S41 family peptidase [bacterium]
MKKGLWMIIIIGLGLAILAYSQESYKDLDVFSEVFSYVQQSYVDPSKTGSKELIYGAINGMLQTLQDPFTRFMTPQAHKEMETELSGQFGGLGIVITIKDNKLVVISPIEDTPAYKIGVKSDDWITHIDGTSTEGINLADAVAKLRGEPGTKVTITITRRKEPNPIIYTITRDVIKIKSVKFEILDDNIGYIRVSSFNNNTISEFNEAFNEISKANPEYIILDLRNNGGGTLQASVGVSGKFLSGGSLVVYTKGRENTPEIRYVAENSEPKVKAKMIILINGGTASGAEILAGALKDHKKGILLGKKTFGKASVQTVYNLSDGSGLALTTAHYYTPAGNLIHGKGIEPNIVVEEEQISEEKRKIIEKFEDGTFTEEFVENYATCTDKEIEQFIASLKKSGIELEKKYILRDIEKEKRELKGEKPSIVDMFCDTQLARAIEIIKAREFWKE